MAIYLSLGSNLGNRRENLRLAIAELEASAVEIQRVSPVVESPALLPPDAAPDWNAPFLNLVVRCRSERPPESLLIRLKEIERKLGRTGDRHWAPRTIDIDILIFDDLILESDHLTIPHAALTERPFVLTPLSALDPGLPVPGTGTTALALSRLSGRIPLWMGIVNVTPDSFSDGGRNQSWAAIDSTMTSMMDGGVHILDFGAESTRPGAEPLTASTEWQRLAPVLEKAVSRLGADALRPAVSIDTYHADVAARAIAEGADIINDVGGLTDEAMLELAATTNAEFVAMHNLGLPADPGRTLDPGTSAVDQVERWLDRQTRVWEERGIDLNRVIFDPGVGFGKTALQSLELLREIDRFADRPMRLLVGHSRKSFMRSFASAETEDRDLVTVGGSMALCDRRVDILRVHNVPSHAAAWRGWAHLQPR